MQFLQNMFAYFRSLGVQVRRILTDNGAAFRSKAFREACERLHLKHRFTRTYAHRPMAKPN